METPDTDPLAAWPPEPPATHESTYAPIHESTLAHAPAESQPVTQEQVSLSLIDIVEELPNHVPPTSRPQVDLLVRLARELGRPVDALKLWEEKHAELSAACADRLELWPLLRIGWNSRLWECVLAVLDFAKAEHSYPEYVRTALQHLVLGGDAQLRVDAVFRLKALA